MNLAEIRQSSGKFLRCECRSLVGYIRLRAYAEIKTQKFKLLLGFESLMSCEGGLELDMKISGGLIDKDATSTIKMIRVCSALAREETTSGGTYKMIDGDPLAWKQLICCKNARAIANSSARTSRGCAARLFGKQASGTLWYVSYLASCSM